MELSCWAFGLVWIWPKQAEVFAGGSLMSVLPDPINVSHGLGAFYEFGEPTSCARPTPAIRNTRAYRIRLSYATVLTSIRINRSRWFQVTICHCSLNGPMRLHGLGLRRSARPLFIIQSVRSITSCLRPAHNSSFQILTLSSSLDAHYSPLLQSHLRFI